MLTVKLKSAEMNIVSGMMDRILDVGTMMPGGLYLSGSRIRAEFRFHPSDLHSVTVLAGGILQMSISCFNRAMTFQPWKSS